MANQSTTSLRLSDCTNVFHNRSVLGKNGNLTPNLSIQNETILSDNSFVNKSQVLNKNNSFVERVRQVANLSGLSLFFPKGSLNDTKLKMKSKKCSDNSLSLTQVLEKLDESSDVTPLPELKSNKGCSVSITFEKSSKDKEEDSLQISDLLGEISTTRFEKSERRKKPKPNEVSINFDCRSQTPSISNDSLKISSLGNSANVSERTRRSTRNKGSVSINDDVSSQNLTSNESKVVSSKDKSINTKTRKLSRKRYSVINGISEKEADNPFDVEKRTKEVLEEQANESSSEKTEGFGKNIKGAASDDNIEVSTEELMTAERVHVNGTEKPESHSQTEMEVDNETLRDNPQNKDISCKNNINDMSVSEEKIKGVEVCSQNEVDISNSEGNNSAMPNSFIVSDRSPSSDTRLTGEQMGNANQENNNFICGTNDPEGQVIIDKPDIPSESPKENLSQNTVATKKMKVALKKRTRIPKLKRLQPSQKFISGNSQKVENTGKKSEVKCDKTDLIIDIKGISKQDCITSEIDINTKEINKLDEIIPLETESLAENNLGGNDIFQKDSIDSLVSGSELSLKGYPIQVDSKSKITRQHCSVHVDLESTRSLTSTSFTVPSKTCSILHEPSGCSLVENNACKIGPAENNEIDDHIINSLPAGSELSLNGNSTAAEPKLKRAKQQCSDHVDFGSTTCLSTTSFTMTPKPILQESSEKGECVIGSALKAPTNDGEIEKEIYDSLPAGSELSLNGNSTAAEPKLKSAKQQCSVHVDFGSTTCLSTTSFTMTPKPILQESAEKSECVSGSALKSPTNDGEIEKEIKGSLLCGSKLSQPEKSTGARSKLDRPAFAENSDCRKDSALVKPTDECREASKEVGQTGKTLPVLDSTSRAPCADSAQTPNINKSSENKMETKVGKILNSTYTIDSQIHAPLGESEENETNQNKELVLPLNPPNKLDLPSSTIQVSGVFDTYALKNPTDECRDVLKEVGQTGKTLPVLGSLNSTFTIKVHGKSFDTIESERNTIGNSSLSVHSASKSPLLPGKPQLSGSPLLGHPIFPYQDKREVTEVLENLESLPLCRSEENKTNQIKELELPLNTPNKLDLQSSTIQASDISGTYGGQNINQDRESNKTVKGSLKISDSHNVIQSNKCSEEFSAENSFNSSGNGTQTVKSQRGLITPTNVSEESKSIEQLSKNVEMVQEEKCSFNTNSHHKNTIEEDTVRSNVNEGDNLKESSQSEQEMEIIKNRKSVTFGVLRRDSHCGEITINETPMENIFDVRGSKAQFAVSRPGRVSEFDLSMTMGVSMISSEPGVNRDGGKGHSTPLSQSSLSNERDQSKEENMNESENVVFASPGVNQDGGNGHSTPPSQSSLSNERDQSKEKNMNESENVVFASPGVNQDGGKGHSTPLSQSSLSNERDQSKEKNMNESENVVFASPGVNRDRGKGHSTPPSQSSLSNEQDQSKEENMNESENVVFAHPHLPLRRSLRTSSGKRSLGQSDIENVSKRKRLDKTGIETSVGTFLNMKDVPQSTPKPVHEEDSPSTTRSTRRSSLAMENKKNQVIQVSKSIFGSSTESSSRIYSKKRRTNDSPPISSPKEPPGKKVNLSPQSIQLKKISTKSVCFMDIPSYILTQSSLRKPSPSSLGGHNSNEDSTQSTIHISRKVSSTSRVQSWNSSSTEESNLTYERGSHNKQHTVHFRNYSSHIDFSQTELSRGMTESSKENSEVPSQLGDVSDPKTQSVSEQDLSSQNQSNKGDLFRHKRFQSKKTELISGENSIQQEPISEYGSGIGESISRIETVAERSTRSQYETSGINTSVPSSDYSLSTTILDPMKILAGRQEEAKSTKQQPKVTLALNLRSEKRKKEKFNYKNNPAFMIDGQPYEPPKSKRFEKWVHPKMLMFITSQLQKHYLNHDCILLDRRIVGYICSTVSAVSKLHQDSDIATATIVLRNILSYYKICSNILEYYLFIRSYTTFDFQRKVLSLNGFLKQKKMGDPLVLENEKLNVDLLVQND